MICLGIELVFGVVCGIILVMVGKEFNIYNVKGGVGVVFLVKFINQFFVGVYIVMVVELLVFVFCLGFDMW